jgi:hypothetical protein
VTRFIRSYRAFSNLSFGVEVVAATFDSDTGGFVLDFDSYVFFEEDSGIPIPTEAEVFSAMSDADTLLFITVYIWNTDDVFNLTENVSFGGRLAVVSGKL